jgi:hypothetical protein
VFAETSHEEQTVPPKWDCFVIKIRHKKPGGAASFFASGSPTCKLSLWVRNFKRGFSVRPGRAGKFISFLTDPHPAKKQSRRSRTVI